MLKVDSNYPMFKNTKYPYENVEVKQIKAKLQTTSLVAITVLLLIVSTVNTADAEPTQIIQGSIDGTFISIMHDGITNIIILEKDGVTSEHYDGVMKTYNSGGFVIKNIESGIVLFAHSIGNEQYRLVVITNDIVYRLIGVSEIISESDAIVAPSSSSLYDEPVSSVGADITKYDIPIINRDDGKDTFLMAFKSTQTLNTIKLNDVFDFSGTVLSVRNNTGLSNVDITLEISRDNYILKSVNTKSGVGGSVRVELDELTYPIFYPEFCYDITVIMKTGNYTHIWTDDFVMEYAVGTVTWEPNMDWTSESRWNYLPQVFNDEPRVSITADENCN